MGFQGKKLAWCLGIPLAVGAVAGWLTAGAMEKFQALAQPPLSPPGWLFPVVWTVLYLLMGYASYRVAVSAGDKEEIDRALGIYGLQLAGNGIWPLLFFNVQWFAGALLWILGLWGLILWTIRRFLAVDKRAGMLLLPYWLWVSFAAYLNWGVYRLNG